MIFPYVTDNQNYKLTDILNAILAKPESLRSSVKILDMRYKSVTIETSDRVRCEKIV